MEYLATEKNKVLMHTVTRMKTWKHDVKWNKPDTKGHILYDSTYMKDSEWSIHRKITQIGGYQGLPRMERNCLIGKGFYFGVMETLETR